MKTSIDHSLPVYEPRKDRRGNTPTSEAQKITGRYQERNKPIAQPNVDKTQSQQTWQSPPDTDQPLTNQDEQRKITNAENADNVVGEGGA